MGDEPRLTVLQVVPSYYPATVYGGPIFSIHYTCQALARQGIDVRVATTNANGDARLDVETRAPVTLEPNYRVRYYDDTVINRFSWAFTRNLWGDIADAALVHLQDVFSAHAAWTLIVSALQKKPLLLSARGVLTPWGLTGKRPWAKKAWLNLLVRPLTANARRVAWHATADSECEEILAAFPGSRVAVIPNGIDLGPFDRTEAPSREAYLRRFFPGCQVAPEKARVLVGMGRLHPKKAFEVAIEALYALRDSEPGAVLLIAGADDGEGERLRRLIAERGLDCRAGLTGEITGADKLAFLKGADLLLFPTHNENFGNVVLEALASGAPVVASRNAPWAALDESGAGRWVENTAAAFAGAAELLLRSESQPLRARARAHAARYDLAAVAGEFKKIYMELSHGR